MKKSILNLGTNLNPSEQKQILGGGGPFEGRGGCYTEAYCNYSCEGECVGCLAGGNIIGYACQSHANQ